VPKGEARIQIETGVGMSYWSEPIVVPEYFKENNIRELQYMIGTLWATIDSIFLKDPRLGSATFQDVNSRFRQVL
jgi:hypothetical protein